jgi:excisionase family DNA binding protein
MVKNEKRVPLWEKYALTVDQAAEYFGIGSKKIRNMICIYKDAKWYMLNGERTLIKRKLFEEFLNETQAI